MTDIDYNIKLILEAQNKANADIVSLQNEFQKLQNQAKGVSSSTSSIFSVIKKGVAALGLTALITKVSKSVVTLGDNLEKAQLSFSTMLGSAEEAEALLKDLSDFAKKTPFELTGVRDNAKQLLAMGIEAQKVVPTLKALGDVSAGVGTSLERITLNYGQVLTQGKLTGKDLRDFMIQGIPLLDELANNLGKTKAEIQDMVSAGKIGFADVEEAFRTMTSEGGRFENLMGKQATTLSGLWSNFQDTLNGIGEEIGQNLLPKLKGYVEQINKRVDENKDNIIYVSGEIVSTVEKAVDSITSVVKGIVGVVEGIARGLADTLSSRVSQLFGNMQDNTTDGLNGMRGDWRDFFGRIQDGLTGIGKSLALVMNTIKSVNQTIGKKTFRQGLWNSGDNTMYDENGEKIGRFQRVKNSFSATGNYLKNAFSDTKKVVEDGANDLVKALEDNYIERVEKILDGGNKTVFKNLNLLGGEGGNGGNDGSGGAGGLGKTKDILNNIKNTYSSITKEVDNQYDSIIKLNKEWQSGFDELQSSLDSVDKVIESLKGDIRDLRNELSQLGKDETSDIATEFVNARKELQKMERDYAGIGEVASKYSLDYLENYEHGGIGKYDIDALIQYKKYSDEMASVYEGMNDQERKAMDEQIAYQERYQSLNGIEKIKEDYRIKREEIQGELNEKLNALHTEELKRAEIEKQMAEYRKEWLNTLDVEIKKRVAMYAEKMNYEKQYQEQLEIDYQKQREMYDELIRKARELAAARASVGGPGGTRANGGPVYSGQQYLVGEHGPELFIPSQNGSVVKNEDLGRGQEFTINVNMGGVVVNDGQDTQQMAEEIANTITRQLELYKKGIY